MRKLLSLGLGIVILFCLCASKNNEEATKSEINNTQVIITCAEKIEFLKENVDYCLYQVKEGEII